ncbi:MAG: hypothetical protein LC772_09720, partial [Chloroflexi bacterium]|nr:hypothetical protein [Chloroflexota bacterium]
MGNAEPPPGVRYRPFPALADFAVTHAGASPDLTRLTEREYARFCFAFSRWVTAQIETAYSGSEQRDSGAHEPRALVVNDISEGPDFNRLHRLSAPMVTLFHVDVVDYFCRIYLRGVISPERITAWYEAICRRGWERWVPPILRLVFGQQRDAVRCSRALVVPSTGMAALLRRCYPAVDAHRFHVVPWGAWSDHPDPAETAAARARLLPLIGPAPVLVTLSRISPEKGIDTLLEALRQLHRMASRLRRSTVHFVGYADPAAKAALFSVADFYVMPSRHES